MYGKKNSIKKTSQEYKASQSIQKDESVSKNQSSQNYMPQCELREQLQPNKNTFKVKEYTSKQRFNQISIPTNPACVIQSSATSDKSIIPKASSSSNANTNMIQQQHIINVFQQLFKKLNQRLDIIEKRESENHVMLLRLTKAKNRRVQLMPKCFPFKSIESLINFDNATDELYDEVVDYFIYIGGLNPIDCAAMYFKYAFQNAEQISLQVT
ncbi:uncharacterized protein LOC105255152 isoform X1 [Camponotus floridanus]|nr:uncharacterized protein LOC105255152 isoform X1 [Camponotus floridanus]